MELRWDKTIEEARAFMMLMPEGVQAKHHLYMLWSFAYVMSEWNKKVLALCLEAAQDDSISKQDLIAQIVGDGSVIA